MSTMTEARNLNHEFEREAEKLRLALNKAIRDCQAALDNMNAGGRPGTGMRGMVLGQTAADVEQAAVRLDMLCDLVGSLVDPGVADAALKGKGTRR